jgi:hypothetical protein
MCPENTYGLVDTLFTSCTPVTDPAETFVNITWTDGEKAKNPTYVFIVQASLAVATGLEMVDVKNEGLVNQTQTYRLVFPSVAAATQQAAIVQALANASYPINDFTNAGTLTIVTPETPTTEAPTEIDGATQISATLAFSAVAVALLW